MNEPHQHKHPAFARNCNELQRKLEEAERRRDEALAVLADLREEKGVKQFRGWLFEIHAVLGRDPRVRVTRVIQMFDRYFGQ